MDWFRFYSSATNDLKLKRIAAKTGQSFPHVLGVWVMVLSIASESPIRGALLLTGDIPVTFDDVSIVTGCNVTETLQLFHESGMIEQIDGVWCVTAWDKRQYASDTSAERVKAYRERAKSPQNGQNQGDVTLQDRYGNVTVTPPEYRVHSTDNTADTVVSAAAPAPEPSPEKPKRPKADTTALLFDPLQDSVLVELLEAHYASIDCNPPRKFQNAAQRDGYRMASAHLGPDRTRQAITQCIVGNRYALGQIVPSLLRWVENDKRGGMTPTRQAQPNEPRGFANLRKVIGELNRGDT